MYAIGASSNLVGRSSACDYPEAARSLPVAGDFGRPSIEFLRTLGADVLVATDLENPSVAARLEHIGIRALILPCEGWDDMLHAATALGSELGFAAEAASWMASITLRYNELRSRAAAYWVGRVRPRVYVEVWGDPITTAGRDSLMNELLEVCGAENIGSDLRGSYVHASAEWVVRRNPDVILTAYMSGGPQIREQIRRRVGWSNIKAVREESICDEVPADLLLRPGPRVIDGAEAFFRWLVEREAGIRSEP